MIKNISTYLLLFAALILTPASLMAQKDAPLEILQARYAALESIQAHFTQSLRSEFMEDEVTQSGQIIMAGQQYRIEFDTQSIISDAETVWIYSPGDAQVLISSVEESDGGFSPGEFFTTYPERYNLDSQEAVTLGNKKFQRLDLSPKSDDDVFTSVTLWVHQANQIISKVRLVDENDTVIEFLLTDIALDPALPADTFKFSPPAGVEVIDLREDS